MSRLFALAFALVIASQAASAGTLERVRDGGVFRIGYRADAKPYSYKNDAGQAAGFIVDEVKGDAYGFGGLSQERRYIAGKLEVAPQRAA